jgi:protein arginine N-methyltransferase 3
MSVSSESEVSGEGDWQDLESDNESITIVSLFDAKTFTSTNDMLEHCKEQHDFDLIALIKRLQLDFHGSIKLVNFIRSNVKAGQAVVAKDISAEDFVDEKYLKPVLENDALLFSLDEILEEQEGLDSGAAQVSGEALAAKNKELEDELEALRSQFANYRLAVEQTLDKRWGDESEPGPSRAAEKKDNSNYYFESYAEHGEFT